MSGVLLRALAALCERAQASPPPPRPAPRPPFGFVEARRLVMDAWTFPDFMAAAYRAMEGLYGDPRHDVPVRAAILATVAHEAGARGLAEHRAMLARLHAAVAAYGTIGHEGSQLLEVMSEAREMLERAERVHEPT